MLMKMLGLGWLCNNPAGGAPGQLRGGNQPPSTEKLIFVTENVTEMVWADPKTVCVTSAYPEIRPPQRLPRKSGSYHGPTFSTGHLKTFLEATKTGVATSTKQVSRTRALFGRQTL